LAIAEFAFNNKVHIMTKSLPFKVNYEQELRMGFKIKKKEKYAKVEKFVKKMKKIHEEAKAALKKLQEKMKKYANRNKKEVVEYKVGNKVLLSIQNLM